MKTPNKLNFKTPILRILIAASFILISVFLTSCSVLPKTSSQTVDVDKIRKDGFVMAKPIVVDIKIESRKIQGTATVKNLLYPAGAVDAARNLAVIDAVKKGDADVIVQPIYRVESNGTTTTATVFGFAAKYKEFRPYTEEDKLAFDLRIKMHGTSFISVIDAPTEVGATQAKKKGPLGF